MKVMLVNTFYYPDIYGGAEISVQKLAEVLASRGIETVVLCNGENNRQERIHGVRIIRLKFNNIMTFYAYKNAGIAKKIAYRAADYYNIWNALVLQAVMEKEKPDVLHTNNLYGISPVIWAVAKKKGIPVLHTVRDYYQLCPKVHLIRKDDSFCRKCSLFCSIYRAGYRKCSSQIEMITAPSKCTLDKFIENKYFMAAEKRIIPNAADFNQTDLWKTVQKRKLDIEEKQTITFMYEGGLQKHKGILWLLNSFMSCKNPNIRLILAGKGKLENFVQNMARKDKRIRYMGFLGEDGLHMLLGRCDVLVVPSVWEEPFGRVVIDAYMSGMPVIGSAIGGIPELIENGKTGFLVKTGDVQELSELFGKLERNRTILKHTYQHVAVKAEKFSLDRQAEEFEECYINLCEKKGR